MEALHLCVRSMKWLGQNSQLALCKGLQHTCRRMYEEVIKRLDSTLHSVCLTFNPDDFQKVPLALHRTLDRRFALQHKAKVQGEVVVRHSF